MKNVRFCFMIVIAAAVLAVSGCAISLGNRNAPDNANPTLGQELVDLKKALDSGAITEAEYQTQRERLIREQKHTPK